jgi:cytochrome d ubiquinol oxidase subunit I
VGRDAVVRMLLGTTLGLHIVLAVAGLALPLFFLVAEYLGIRRSDRDYLDLARRGSRAFAVVFAVGTVTGTLVAGELAILWAPFMTVASQVIILPFFIEGFAFILESAFIGMYLYGWNHFRGRWTHLLTGVPVVVASAASGLLIVVVNAWMNAPAGFRLEGGRVEDVHPWAAFFNPAVWTEDAHVLFTAYAMVGMVLLALACRDLLSDPARAPARKAAALSAWISMASLVGSIITGDLSGKWLAAHQPEKLAALEGLFRTQAYAPEVVGGIVSLAHRTVYGALDLPGVLSWLAYGSASHPVKGLLAFPPSTWPPSALVHLLFDAMVGLGSAMLLLTVAYLAASRNFRRPPRWLLWAGILGGPAAVVTLECGWLVAEFGRQPWVIYNLMRVDAGITRAPGVVPVGWAILALLVAVFAAAPFAVARVVKERSTGPERSAAAGEAP